MYQTIVITNCWQLQYSSQYKHINKAVPAFTIRHYIANKYQLLIGLENSRDQCFKTKTKTAEFRSRAVSRPRPRSRGLQDWFKRFFSSCWTYFSQTHLADWAARMETWWSQRRRAMGIYPAAVASTLPAYSYTHTLTRDKSGPALATSQHWCHQRAGW